MALRPPILTLVDGTLCDNPQAQRAEAVAHAARELIRFEAFADEADARLVLRCLGYSAFELQAPRFLDDARQVAAQHVLAREMAPS